MSFSTKATLKTAVIDWLARSDVTANGDDQITLAEARLNRDLGEILTEQTLTGVLSSTEISVSSYSVARPINLFLAETGLDEVELTPKMDGTFPRSVVTGRPSYWSYVAGSQKIIFDRPLSGAYPFRFKFRQRFSLAADGDTNWLLTYHPDIYLAASILWGGLYTQDNPRMATFAAVLEQGIPSVKAYISAQNKAVLTVDPALACNRPFFDYTTGQ
jgi:hypothetical protein